MNFEWITSSEDFDALGDAWRALTRDHATGLQLFQSYVWNRTWWAHFGSSRNFDLRILAGRDAGELVFVWPLMRRRGPVHTLEQIGGLLSPYEDVLVHSQVDPAAWIDRAWDEIELRRDVHVVRLRGVHEGSVLAEHVARRAGPAIGETLAPFVDLESVPDYDTYLASRAKKVRSELRRSRRMLSETGDLRRRIVEDEGEIADVVDRMFEFKARWLKARALSGKMVMTDRGQAFVREVASALARPGREGRTAIDVLEVRGRPIAIGVGFEFKGRHYEYLDAFDDAYERAGPGRLRLADGIRDCAERGLSQYDLLTPATWFKTIWTEERPRVRQYANATNLRGRFYRDVYLRTARPILKRGYNSRWMRWTRRHVQR